MSTRSCLAKDRSRWAASPGVSAARWEARSVARLGLESVRCVGRLERRRGFASEAQTPPTSATGGESSGWHGVLDFDQRSVLSRWDSPRLVINAGPGSGKTTVLCALAAEIRRRAPDASVLVLAFNREARRVVSNRIETLGCQDDGGMGEGPVLAAKEVHRARIPQGMVGVRTFNEFARGIVEMCPSIPPCGVVLGDQDGKPGVGASSDDYDPELFAAALALRTLVPKDLRWDWLIVDEGQDVQIKHVGLISELQQRCSHFVVAGDPRQELYPGAMWFSNLWVDTPEHERAFLRFNHRSHPRIVSLLNAYSARAFPQLHVDQISAIEQREGHGMDGISDTGVDVPGLGFVVYVFVVQFWFASSRRVAGGSAFAAPKVGLLSLLALLPPARGRSHTHTYANAHPRTLSA